MTNCETYQFHFDENSVIMRKTALEERHGLFARFKTGYAIEGLAVL